METCQRDVRSSDHYILILGERYGNRQTDYDGKSLTELEFEAALGMAISAITLSELLHGVGKSTEPERNLAVVENFCSRL